MEDLRHCGDGSSSRHDETERTKADRADSITGSLQESAVGTANKNEVDAIDSITGGVQETAVGSANQNEVDVTGSSGNNDLPSLPEGYEPDDVIHKDKKYRRVLLHIATILTADDDWTELGSFLGITLTDLRGIRTNYEEVKERAYQMLIKWTECTEKPTLKLLIDALKGVKKIQLVDEIADGLHQNGNPPQGEHQVTETHFRHINNDIVDDWKFIGRYLGIEENAIRQIDRDYKTVKEKAYQILIKWKQSNGRKATLEVLKAALKDAGREDVVSKL